MWCISLILWVVKKEGVPLFIVSDAITDPSSSDSKLSRDQTRDKRKESANNQDLQKKKEDAEEDAAR